MLQKNIVHINEDQTATNEKIQTFLESMESEETRKAYETDIRKFFEITRGKESKFITQQDLYYTHQDILNYKNELRIKYSPNSINRKLATIRSFFDYLAKDDPNIRTAIFKVKRVKDTSEGYGDLTPEETDRMIELAKGLKDGFEKSMILQIAKDTSFRLSSILDMKWSDIKRLNGRWVAKVIGKGGKVDRKPIIDEVYNNLLQLKNPDNNKVFNIEKRAVQRVVEVLRDKMGLEKERKITFHSLKKTAINWEIDENGDVIRATRQGNHSNMQTMYKHYLKKTADYGSMAGIQMYEKQDLSVLEGLTKEELLNLIKNSKRVVQRALVEQARDCK